MSQDSNVNKSLKNFLTKKKSSESQRTPSQNYPQTSKSNSPPKSQEKSTENLPKPVACSSSSLVSSSSSKSVRHYTHENVTHHANASVHTQKLFYHPLEGKINFVFIFKIKKNILIISNNISICNN